MALSKPNFFIIGAPKCGTTSLHNYLKSHSQITMSIPKEPHYFSTDIKNGGIRNKEKYADCFSHGKRNAKAIGESSKLIRKYRKEKLDKENQKFRSANSQLEWNTRVFDQRTRLTEFVCEEPVLNTQRLGYQARKILSYF